MDFLTEQVTSDGGALLLDLADRKLGLTEALAAAVHDRRQQSKVRHPVEELVRQRIYAIALGYSDCNDFDHLRKDPVLRMLHGKSLNSDSLLGSQPTLSRLENSVTRADLFRMGQALADRAVLSARKKYGKKVKLITLDLDPTVDPTHGQQQLSLFNGHYDSWCYLPLPAFMSFDDHPEMHLFACLLRPGNARATLGAIGILKRILPRLRKAFPKARVRVRLDGGFATAEMFDYLDSCRRLEYLVSMPKNSRLETLAEPLMKRIRRESKCTGETTNIFGEVSYAARSWRNERRVVVKAEMVCAEGKDPRDNARFVVTNMRHGPENLYQLYRDRGECENRIKELKQGVEMDRTSCTSFLANQFRVLLSSAAMMLFQEIRYAARGTSCERAQAGTIRLRLLKIGAQIVESVRRLIIHAPKAYPWLKEFRVIARRLRPKPA